MLTLATAADPVLAPADVWAAWNPDPLVLGGLVAAAWLYRQGTSGADRAAGRWRGVAFAGGLVAVAVALVSPLDALSGALASAHMVQHVLLTLVAAPLLALSMPSHRLLRGSPMGLRRASGRWRRRLGLSPVRLRALRHPAVAWFLPVATLWLWHARVLYDAAVDDPLVHVLEHGTFLATALLFWSVVVGVDRERDRPYGLAILLVFTMAMQSVFLSVLMTFAGRPWYDAYTDSAPAFGLTPLADQQLAGVIMWVPAGAIYLAAALTLVVRWLQRTEEDTEDGFADGAQVRPRPPANANAP